MQESVRSGEEKSTLKTPKEPVITRRALLEWSASVVALLSIGGVAKAFAGEKEQLRPPGGQNEERLLSSCIRCDRCRAICPTKAIGVGGISEGVVNVRLPVLDFREGYCSMCDGDFKCIAACPTGALSLFDPKAEKLGMAIVDETECQLYGISGHCDAPCIDACEWDALSLDQNGRLVVDEALCNGCGACEYVCPTSAYRSYGASGNRGINVRVWGADHD